MALPLYDDRVPAAVVDDPVCDDIFPGPPPQTDDHTEPALMKPHSKVVVVLGVGL